VLNLMNQSNAMKATTARSLSLLYLFVVASSLLNAQVSSPEVVIEISEFSSEKNMSVYTLFSGDADVVIVNSCDIMGVVVLKAKTSSSLTKNTMKAYLQLRIDEVLEPNGYEIKEEMDANSVLEDCREAMQEAY
jgi:hypothetical protein